MHCRMKASSDLRLLRPFAAARSRDRSRSGVERRHWICGLDSTQAIDCTIVPIGTSRPIIPSRDQITRADSGG